MCGICGKYNYMHNQPVDLHNIKAMAKVMNHRGPDDEGYFISGAVGLGFKRLSIIDLEGGHQPMSDNEKTVWVVFNGEIYNFRELRSELESFGYEFKTKSDTEVIVYGYKKWGDDVLNHLNGMFGLAIWDDVQKRLLLARDRMGIKIIYYKINSGSLSFGSEIRSLLLNDSTKLNVDPIALNLFLRYRYTPSPYTIFNGFKKLAPGTRLIIENNTLRIERWWNFKPSPFDPMPNIKTVKEQLLELYKKAVQRHLISDVPIGLLLSGGLDSGLLLALMSLNNESRKTFTVGYGESFKFDELKEAAYTAKMLNQSHHSVMITKEIFNKTLPKVIKCLEEPIASSSIVPMYHVCEFASKEVKVALVGQGPDELFGGYNRHLGIRYGHYWRAFPRWIRDPIKSLLNFLPRNESIKRSLYSLDVPDRMQRYQQVFSIMPGQVIDNLFKDGIILPHTGDKILECWKELFPLIEGTDELGGLQFLEIRSSLPDELLMYADKLSMAHSLELRVPYLDFEIVEFVERLPARYKVNMGIRKWLHREVCKNFLPREIIRRKKRGFAVNVVDDWFRDSVYSKTDSIFFDDYSIMYNYLKKEEVQQIYVEHQKGMADNHKLLFSLVVFEEWLRAFN